VTTTWKRFQYTYTLSGTDAAAQIMLWDNIVGNDETADVLVYGCQIELGSGASSYIPTGASSVQRAADSCSIALSTFGFNTAEGTFYVDFFRKNVSSGSGSAIATDYASTRWLGIDTASGSNTVNLNSWGGTTSSANGSTRNKVGASYGAWTGSAVPVSLCVNNTAAVTGNRDFNPSNATYLTIGAASSSSGTNPPYGVAGRDWLNNCVAAVKYWPVRLPDNTLRVITA
jgi:predicted outer membrane repeat protein